METSVRVNSIDMNYFDSAPGAAGGEAVVLIHGLGGCWQAWRFQQRFLEELGGVRVVALDLRGHGGSSKPHSPFTIEEMADDVAALMERLSLGPSLVVGHSLGGMVSFCLAAVRPDLVKRLIIINSFSRIPKVRLKAVVKLVFRTSIIYTFGLKAWGRVLAWELLPGVDQAHLRSWLIELSELSDDRTAYMNAMKAAVKVDLRPLLPRIKCPVKLLSADRDYTAVADKENDARLINRDRDPVSDDLATVVEIEHSRHLSLWDQPVRVNDEIASFLGP